MCGYCEISVEREHSKVLLFTIALLVFALIFILASRESAVPVTEAEPSVSDWIPDEIPSDARTPDKPFVNPATTPTKEEFDQEVRQVLNKHKTVLLEHFGPPDQTMVQVYPDREELLWRYDSVEYEGEVRTLVFILNRMDVVSYMRGGVRGPWPENPKTEFSPLSLAGKIQFHSIRVDEARLVADATTNLPDGCDIQIELQDPTGQVRVVLNPTVYDGRLRKSSAPNVGSGSTRDHLGAGPFTVNVEVRWELAFLEVLAPDGEVLDQGEHPSGYIPIEFETEELPLGTPLEVSHVTASLDALPEDLVVTPNGIPQVVSFGESYKQVKARLGEPEEEYNGGYYGLCYRERLGLIIWLDTAVKSIEIVSPKYEAPNDLRVGIPFSEAVAALGPKPGRVDQATCPPGKVWIQSYESFSIATRSLEKEVPKEDALVDAIMLRSVK